MKRSGNTKLASDLKKGDNFRSPHDSELIWIVDEVRQIENGKVELLTHRGMNNLRFTFRNDQEVEMA
jgi:hypothetical protein